MIHIEKGSQPHSDKLTITIEGFCMAEVYATTISQIIGLLKTQNPEICTTSEHYYAVLDLLEAMMPDGRQVKAMIGVKADE